MAAMRTSLSATASLVQMPARVAFKPVSMARRNTVVAKASSQKTASLASLGVAATTLLAQQAHAANEVAELADGDNRLLILAVIFVPALGWVAFNILGPALNQLANMDANSKLGDTRKGGRR